MSKSTLKSKVIYAVKVVSLLTVFAVMGTVIITACWCVDNLQSADNPVQEQRDRFFRRRKESAWQTTGLSVYANRVVRTKDWTAYYIEFTYPPEANIPVFSRWVVLDDSNSKYYIEYVPIDKL